MAITVAAPSAAKPPASIYNALPEEGIDALVDFMREFERKNG